MSFDYENFHREYNKIIAKRMKLEVKNAKKRIREAIKEATDEIFRELEEIPNEAAQSVDWYNDGAGKLHTIWFKDFIKEQTEYFHPVRFSLKDKTLICKIAYTSDDTNEGFKFPYISFAQRLVDEVLEHGEGENSGREDFLEAIYALPDQVDALLDKERPSDRPQAKEQSK